MKFISKNTNYLLVLRQGVGENRHLGIPSVPGLYVRFESNIANIEDKETIDLMMKHKGYGTSFVVAEENKDWESKSSEPEHILSEVKHGGIEKTVGGGKTLSPEIKKLLKGEATKMAVEMAKEMAPLMAMELVKEMANKQKADNTHVITKEDLDTNPGLDSEVKEGDSVELPLEEVEIVNDNINKTSKASDSEEVSEEEGA